MARSFLNKKFKENGYKDYAVRIMAVYSAFYLLFCIFFKFYPKGLEFFDYLYLSPDRIIKHYEFWRFFTYPFFNGDFINLLTTFLSLFFIGRNLEKLMGSKEYLCFYIVSTVLGGMLFVASSVIMGKSGLMPPAVQINLYAQLMLMALLIPDSLILLFFVIPVKMRTMILIILVIDVFLSGVNNNFNYLTLLPIWGLTAGALYATFRMRIPLSNLWRGKK